jgi:hypothetical protein
VAKELIAAKSSRHKETLSQGVLEITLIIKLFIYLTPQSNLMHCLP